MPPKPRHTRGERSPSRGLLAAATLGACTTLAFGCASILEIDGDYVAVESTGGRRNTGGTATGGAETGGTADTGGTGSECGTCDPGKKCCSGSCVLPAPELGCSTTSCTPCPIPIENAEGLCLGELCSARCSDGFVPQDGACVSVDASTGTGGAGTGGTGEGGSATGGAATGGGESTGGGSGTCNPLQCPRCTDPLQGIVPCCRPGGGCGCSWFQLAYCVN